MRNQYGHCVLRVQLALNLLKYTCPSPPHNNYIPCSCRRVSRLKKHNKKNPVREDLQRLKARVMEAGVLQRQVENVIPQISWTPDFVR